MFTKIVCEQGHSLELYDDVYLLRFLRARKFDMKDTTEMWNKYVAWRKDQDVDNVMVTCDLS